MIKQAIIPLAGLGTRLLPLTSVFAKELLPINGKPGLEYILKWFANEKKPTPESYILAATAYYYLENYYEFKIYSK